MPFILFLLFISTAIPKTYFTAYCPDINSDSNTIQMVDLQLMGLKGAVKNIKEVSTQKGKLLTNLYEFNEAGNLILEEYYEDTVLNKKLIRTYDEQGVLTLKTIHHQDFSSLSTTYEYNRKGQLIKEIESDEDYTLFKYNGKGQLVEETVYAGEDILLKITYDYNKRGDLIESAEYDSDGRKAVVEILTYNELGLKTSITEFEGEQLIQERYFVYNGANQLIEEGIKDANATIEQLWKKEYDQNGNLKQLIWTDITSKKTRIQSFEYDQQGNWIVHKIGETQSTTREIQYF